jgi:ankyrin repeat protein
MKQFLSLLTVLLLCCFCNRVNAQQTYIRNYSTFTEYGTIPAATVPSSYKSSYTAPAAYEYHAPEKSAEELAHDDEMQDIKITEKELSEYYARKDYNSVLAICKDFEDRYPEGSLHPYIGVYMAGAYLETQQYEVLANKLNAKYQYFGDRHDFDLAAADVLQQYGYYERAYWYYGLADKHRQKMDGYELGYSVTAARQDHMGVSEYVFSTLMKATNNNPGNYYNRALAFLNAKNPSRDLALQDLVTFVTKTTETLDAYLLMAKIYSDKGNSEECISAAKEYMKLHDCKECEEMIAKAEAEIADRPRKAALAAEQEQKNKENSARLEQQYKEKKIKDDAEAAVRASDSRSAFKMLEDEFAKYVKDHNLYTRQEIIYSGEIKYNNFTDAIKRGDLKSVFILYKQSKPGDYFSSPLYKAIEEQQYEIAEFLIENNIDLDMKAQLGMNALHFVCAEYFYDYYSPPENTITRRSVKVAKLLIDKGFDVNKIDEDRSTPLHYAAVSGNLAMVKMLLEHDVKPFSKVWPYAATPLDCVMRSKSKNKEIIKLLKAHDPE